MKTDRGYIVAMHNLTNKIVTISLEMWDLIENTDDYKPLYRADDKKDAENYVKEISSNIQKESTMVNKLEFIKKAKEWLEDINFEKMYQYSEDGYTFFDKESFIDDFLKVMEE